MPAIQKPYDLLFRHTLSSDVALRDFFRIHFPKVLSERIDFKSLRATKQSYVPSELREFHSDLVCTCTIDGQEAFIYLLVEHQSSENWLMPLRFIKYKVALIEDYLSGKGKETPWPLVVCACFYHGEQSPYPYSTHVHDYFTDPWLAQTLGIFTHFHLIDITVAEETDLKQHASLALMERILQYSKARDAYRDSAFLHKVAQLLEEYSDSLLSLESPLGNEYWYAVYLVLVSLSGKHGHSEEAVAALFAEKLNLSKTKEGIMTITQEIRQEALQEGRQEEKLGIAKEMLQKGYTSDVVKELTGLAREELKQLQVSRQA